MSIHSTWAGVGKCFWKIVSCSYAAPRIPPGATIAAKCSHAARFCSHAGLLLLVQMDPKAVAGTYSCAFIHATLTRLRLFMSASSMDCSLSLSHAAASQQLRL